MAKSNFLLNATALVGSNVISQLVAVLSSIVEARLYTPLEMGVYSTYVAILAILTVIACLQYEHAIILTKDEKEAKDLIFLCFIILLSLGAVVFLTVYTLSTKIASWLNVPQMALWIKLLPFGLLVAGTLSIMQYWNIKNSNFRLIAIVNVITVIVMNLLQIGFGLERFHTTGGMILGHLLGNTVAIALYISINGKFIFRKRRMNLGLMARFKQFPLFNVPSTFLDNFGANSPNLLLTNFFGAAVTGYYALGYRLLSLPVSVISNALRQAFLPKAVEAKQYDTLANATRSVFEYILKLAPVPLVLAALTANTLITTIFGSVWITAASYIPWLCFWLFLALMYSPISSILIVLERQRDALFINVLRFVIKVAALCLGGLYGNALLAVASCSVVSGLASLAACFYIMYLVKVDFIVVVRLIIRYCIRTTLFVCPTIIALVLDSNNIVQLITVMLNGCVFLVVSSNEFLPLLRKKK